ncbi:hypothetical protein M413DRAFT_31630 [Hebeloma cylindrosporum]|uniref:Uncharacterized protein n=1 Tax=Hebeloma cylindrosporum TaxID=76867 RepID=A0A0C2Y6F4_HEBCY|nr:hypothetical protein M413DRAFT_31630 [Hebeloma cylindrosporum h7]
MFWNTFFKNTLSPSNSTKFIETMSPHLMTDLTDPTGQTTNFDKPMDEDIPLDQLIKEETIGNPDEIQMLWKSTISKQLSML